MINIELLSETWTRQEFFSKGHIVMKEGEKLDDKMYIIKHGSIGIYKNFRKRGEFSVAVLGSGVTDAGAYLEGFGTGQAAVLADPLKHARKPSAAYGLGQMGNDHLLIERIDVRRQYRHGDQREAQQQNNCQTKLFHLTSSCFII